MKKIICSVLLVILYTGSTPAQTATIHFNIKNSGSCNCTLSPQNNLSRYGKEKVSLPLNKNGQATYSLKITRPRSFDFYCERSKSDQWLSYSFFLSPGDKLTFNADMLAKDYQIAVTGKGSNNNQSIYKGSSGFDPQKFYGDTVPDRVISAILKKEKQYKTELEKYSTRYKPTKEFIEAKKLNLTYWAASAYFSFKENNKFQVKSAYKRNLDKWQSIQDSLFNIQPLDNPNALSSRNYTLLITDFLGRKKEALWTEQYENKNAFYKEWYGGDQFKGEEEYMADKSNALREKIIKKYFKGKTAEYLYAHLIVDAIDNSDPKNLLNIYSRFKDQYPVSEYDAKLKTIVNAVKKRQERGLNERMVFADSTAKQLNTLDDLLKLAKNKTVLVDMWGTWCSPCRQEIEKNSAEIKKHFKGKDLEYFYVANYDTGNTKAWKELISYFNLEGTHILASQTLTESVMNAVKGKGYPTYFLIKKDGRYELSKAGYPMERTKLIQQLEEALK
ncbi:TlpA family protein disulfide reductase [Pedobacter africanus]|uniref:Thiol-disulfide isomerase or thioredoxin n=1 Tax=Pedobacter africanus TaxID=151894 RepID=A0A1W2BCY4_9SPHI|nr:TlpA disulfide reductase family protein [Pedobacter africanus]SMC70681.1 Thiol-disulfide isomerase or thioredoxin [Pedobacter africanus]